MAVIQISKIQLRRGLQQEIGVDTLDDGEPAFATDTGRLFIGTDPTQTGPWTGRTVVPYNAVEILTETSLDTFARLYDRMSRLTGPSGMVEGLINRRPYMEAQLAASTPQWTDIAVNSYSVNGQPNGSTETINLTNTRSVGGVISYTLFDQSNAIRTGVLTINHNGNSSSDQAQMADEYNTDLSVVSSGAVYTVDTLLGSDIRFRAVRVGQSPNYSFRLQYWNGSSSSLRMQLRVMVAAKTQS